MVREDFICSAQITVFVKLPTLLHDLIIRLPHLEQVSHRFTLKSLSSHEKLFLEKSPYVL